MDGDKISCFSCKELVSPSYQCPKCHIFLEKKLEELPEEIKHPLHRLHPLFLCMQSPYPSGNCICDLCGKTVNESIYHCAHCKFDLDIKCALRPCITEPRRLDAHRFVHLIRTISFICDACGTAGDEYSPYVCTMCQLMFHNECISLPTAIRITEHDHRISHKYFLHENESVSAHPYCGICHEELKIEHGAYYCSNCDYAAHVNCAKQHIINGETTAEDEDHPNALTDGSRAGENVVPEGGAEVTKNQQAEVAKNQRFCHEHDLIIIDDENTVDNKRCDGCMLLLSAPISGCRHCDLFLHKKCSELPAKLRHPLHNHLLTLLPNAPSVDGVFKCSACDQYCHGFSYNCDRCDFYLDVRCSAITKSLQHHGHEHLLHLALGEGNYGCYCGACYHGKFTYFCCDDCDFTLDFGCATLPNTVTHRFDDDHPLKLSFNVDYDPLHDYCEECEKKRDPEVQFYDKAPWFYHCPDCKLTFHPECVLGSFPYIKFEGAYLCDIHPHPLTLVQKDRHYPPCDNCAEPFFVGEKVPSHDLALECKECKFVIHRKDPCFSQHVKAGKLV